MTILIANKDDLLPVRAFSRKRDAIKCLEQMQRERVGRYSRRRLDPVYATLSRSADRRIFGVR